jgi:hypothetical protein
MSNKDDDKKGSETPSNIPKGFEKFFKKRNTDKEAP